jgi:hypothetical protein
MPRRFVFGGLVLTSVILFAVTGSVLAQGMFRDQQTLDVLQDRDGTIGNLGPTIVVPDQTAPPAHDFQLPQFGGGSFTTVPTQMPIPEHLRSMFLGSCTGEAFLQLTDTQVSVCNASGVALAFRVRLDEQRMVERRLDPGRLTVVEIAGSSSPQGEIGTAGTRALFYLAGGERYFLEQKDDMWVFALASGG